MSVIYVCDRCERQQDNALRSMVQAFGSYGDDRKRFLCQECFEEWSGLVEAWPRGTEQAITYLRRAAEAAGWLNDEPA